MVTQMKLYNLGFNIKKERQKLNLTQAELADKLRIARSSLSKWETSESYPDIESLVKLAEIFDLTTDQLIGRDSREKELIQELKRIYGTIESFDHELIKVSEYLMRNPNYKEQLFELQKLPLYQQEIIFDLIKNYVKGYK